MQAHQENTVEWVNDIAKHDSQKAFKSLYHHYYERLLRFVFLHVPLLAEAEEIVSDIFLSIWNNRKKLPEIKNFDAYIYAMARYKAISHLRSRTENKIRTQEISVDLYASTETTPEDDFINQEKIIQLNNAINRLPYKCKMAFKMVREDKMKYKEVAAVLDISVKTVEAHLSTATKKLRETLAQYQE